MDLNSVEIKFIEQRKNPAAALSFVISGAGQIYNGDVGKGVAMIVGCIVCWALAALVFPLFLLPVIWICGIVEAHSRANDINVALKKRIAATGAEEEASRQQTISSADFVAQIQKYYKLKDNSLLSEEEFEAKKKDAISSLIQGKIVGPSEDFLTALIPLVREKVFTDEEIGKIKAAIL